MKQQPKPSATTRRKFLTTLSGGLLTGTLAANRLAANHWELQQPQTDISSKEVINLACIGMGIQGFNDVNAALENPAIRLIAVCDLYQGRLDRAREVYGNDLFITRNYQDILERADIDTVIIATTDHWHDHLTIAALDAGKHVYCEKPMVQHLDEGHDVLEAEKRNKGVLIVGSQRVSSILLTKAREIYERGDIGQLVLVETFNDRFSAMGAWQYSIPRDASTKTIDWEAYHGDAPKIPFDAKRFFRWRNYQDYGTGMAGDLFVHLFSGTHRMLGSLGPNRIFATGGLRYWNDGRDVPDVFIASCDYGDQANHSAFNMQLRVNFASGDGGGSRTRLIGTEGSMELSGRKLVVRRNSLSAAPGFGGWDSYNTFTEKQQAEFEKWYKATYPPAPPEVVGPSEEIYTTPDGYSDHVHHFENWFTAIRENGKVIEDGAFGFRAAAPSLAANKSYFEKKIVQWNPVTMEAVE